MSAPVVAVASIIQETNTFSAQPTDLDDFEVQGLWSGEEAARRSMGANSEFAGALASLTAAGAETFPVVRAWAMSGGILRASAFEALERLLLAGLEAAGHVDALVLSLHGAMVAEGRPSADLALVESARALLGTRVPLVVCLDLHANVTPAMARSADAVIGYHTYPHVDQGDTGRRAALLALRMVGTDPEHVSTAVAKRPLLIPPEAQAMSDHPMRGLRRLADDLTTGDVLDVSIFPVQPWLDVPDLGFAVTATTMGDHRAAWNAANTVADAAWHARGDFQVRLLPVSTAVANLERGNVNGPVLLIQSADSPTAGATADDATVIGALDRDARGIRSLATVVDHEAVDACWEAGPQGSVRTMVGSTLDSRWSPPVAIAGVVLRTGDDPVVLTGAAMTGQRVSLGRWATIDNGAGLQVLLTERAAPTFDPESYRHVGLDPADAEAVVVRSATLYRAGWEGMYSHAVVLDLPGASTPQLSYLPFERVSRPLFPLDPHDAEYRWDTDE